MQQKFYLDFRMSYAFSNRDLVFAVSISGLGYLFGYLTWVVAGGYVALGTTLFILFAFLVLLVITIYRRIVKQISKQSHEQRALTVHASENCYRQVEALINLRAELSVQGALPPMRGWAISPDFANLIVRKIEQQAPTSILECGAGVSSLIIGMVLRKKLRGHVLSLEHNAEYARVWKQRIHEHGLDDYVTVRHAPLVKYVIDGQEWEWYDTSGVSDSARFDLLVVDGPPDGEGRKSRFPVLHVLKQHIRQGAIMLLDDANRPAERECLTLWVHKEYATTYEFVATEKGSAVVTL